MYRITVKSRGKYGNVLPGPRYCICKKTAKRLIDLFYVDDKCVITVEKWIRIHGDVFCWTDIDDTDSVLNYFDELCYEEEE